MSFNPYEILANLRKNSNRDPQKSFDADRPHETSTSGWKPPIYVKNIPAQENDLDRSRDRSSFSLNPNTQSDQRTDLTTLSSNRNFALDSKDRVNSFDQEAAIKSYKNLLAQELPELLVRQGTEQDSLWLNEKSVQNTSGYESRNATKREGSIPRNDSKSNFYHAESSNRRMSDINEDHMRNTRRSASDNPVDLSSSMREKQTNTQRIVEKSPFANKEKKSGTLRLGPFIHLKENYPQFPASIIKINLRELDGI